MGRVAGILTVALALAMAGCALNGAPKTAAANVPPPPQPAAQSKTEPVAGPLSVPQTQVELPPPQPLNLDALSVAPPPASPAEPPAAARPVRRTGATPPPVKPEVTGTPAPTAEPERPPIQEIVPADERKRYQESADGRKREIRQLLEQVKTRRLTSDQNKIVNRINQFLRQSDDVEKRGDMRQADALAERALVLAKELAGEK